MTHNLAKARGPRVDLRGQEIHNLHNHNMDLTKKLQEARDENAELQAKNAELQAKNAELQKRLLAREEGPSGTRRKRRGRKKSNKAKLTNLPGKKKGRPNVSAAKHKLTKKVPSRGLGRKKTI